MTSFVVLYRGRSLADARLVALTSDPQVVRTVARSTLVEQVTGGDAALDYLTRGRREALRIIASGDEG